MRYPATLDDGRFAGRPVWSYCTCLDDRQKIINISFIPLQNTRVLTSTMRLDLPSYLILIKSIRNLGVKW